MKWRWRMLGILGAGYVLIYVALTLGGHYGGSPTGRLRYSFGLSVTHRLQWDPQAVLLRLTGSQAIAMDGPGFVFLPLVVIDRLVWHRDVLYAAPHG